MAENEAGTDERLAIGARQGDRTALASLWRRHEAGLRRLCGWMAVRESDAADLTQDIYLRLSSQIDRYDESRPFRVWLYAMARHAIIDHLRRRGRGWDIERELAMPPDTTDEDPVLRAESAERVRRAVRRLPEAHRLVVLYSLWEGLSPSEIAEALGVPAGRVRVHLFRALKALEKELKET